MTREQLRELMIIDNNIETKLRQLEELKNTYKITCDLGKERVQTSTIDSAVETTVMKIIDLENQITCEIDKLVDKKNVAKKAIKKLEPLLGTIIEMRYMECMGWQEIADRLGFSVQHIYRLHTKALKEINKL